MGPSPVRLRRLLLSHTVRSLLELFIHIATMEAPPAAQRTSSGLLQQPPGWLYSLVRRVPASDKLAMFQTCRQLARQVMQSTHRITVYARPQTHSAKGFDPHYTLTQLSWGSPSVLDVMARVLAFERPACPEDSFGWARLGNLKELRWYGCISQHDIVTLCEALEQGHLHQLTSFTLKEAGTGSDALYARLARVLGHQLTQLNTNQVQFMRHLRLFEHLTSVWVYWVPAELLANVASDLNSSPGLHNFRVVGHYNVSGRAGEQGEHSSGGKKWSLTQTSYASIAALPLSHVTTVEIGSVVCGMNGWDLATFTGNLQRGQGRSLCTTLLELVNRGLITLHGNSSRLLDKLWTLLPACVQHVHVVDHSYKRPTLLAQ